MESLLNTLLIVVLSFFLLGYLIRLLTPLLLRWYSRRLLRKFETFHNTILHTEEENPTPKKKKTQSASPDSIGEYVDFEEIKDE